MNAVTVTLDRGNGERTPHLSVILQNNLEVRLTNLLPPTPLPEELAHQVIDHLIFPIEGCIAFLHEIPENNEPVK